jgi:hypothetical protein
MIWSALRLIVQALQTPFERFADSEEWYGKYIEPNEVKDGNRI